MKFRLTFFILGFLFLVFFYLFSWQVKLNRFEQLNFDFTVRLQDNMPKRLGEIWEDLGFFVSPISSVIIVSIITIVGSIDFKRRKIHPGIFIVPLAFLLMVGIEIYGKAKVESPAPPFFLLKSPTTILPKYHVQELYSYPSGHAARAFFLSVVGFVVVLKKIRNRRIHFFLGLIFFAAALGISIGKVYLGHHWMSDIIGGWLIALACLAFAVPFISFLFVQDNSKNA